MVSKLAVEPFHSFLNGAETHLYTLSNGHGMACQITNYGGRIVSIYAADKYGNIADVVLGHDSITGYINDKETYFGAIIGRVGNRISDGKFELKGKTYLLSKNEGNNHLHGGEVGFHNKVWNVRKVDSSTLSLHCTSPNGESGYPGNINVDVVYKLTEENELQIRYSATTDQSTPLSLTNHAYFNLNGAGNESILNHTVQINANRYLLIRHDLIPTGAIDDVQDTPFDLRKPISIAALLAKSHDQLTLADGIDHHFIPETTGIRSVAMLKEHESGRTLEVITDAPGVQFYTGNFLNGTISGKNGTKYPRRSGCCFEAQGFPDSPNQKGFPSVILHPNETYTALCIYKFGVGE